MGNHGAQAAAARESRTIVGPQDHGDLIAFTMAIVHCDIVVFDKHWSALARRAGLDAANDTILCRFHELPTHLMAAAA